MKFCPHCGAPLTAGARFCENCGAAVAAFVPAGAAAGPAAPVGGPPPFEATTAQVPYAGPPAQDAGPHGPVEADSGPIWAAEPAEVEPEERKSRRGLITAIGGTAAVGVLGVVGFVVYSHFTGPNGGADSPQAAVTELSAAADSEDAVTALSLLPPGEVGSVVDLYQDVEKKATSTGIAAKDNPFAGFDLHVKGVAVKTQQLGADVAAVTITKGTVSWNLDPAKLQGPLRVNPQGGVRHASSGSADLVQVTRNASNGSPLRLMTIKRDGKWYVSPMYTLLELWRTNSNLPAPDFSKPIDYSGTGASSATDAVQQAAKDLAAYNIDGFLDLLSPDEAAALYQYRSAILTSLQQDGSLSRLQSQARLTVDSVSSTAGGEVDGRVPVTVRGASGTLADSNGNFYNWSLSRNCLTYVQNGNSHGACLDKALSDQGVSSKIASQFPSLTLLTQQVDGRWYLSPMATLVTDARNAVAKLSTDDVASLLRVPQFGGVDGQLAVGKTLDGSIDQPYGYGLYEMKVPAGKVFSACVKGGDANDWLAGPDGQIERSSAVLAKDGGEYRVLVSSGKAASFTVTPELSDVTAVAVPGNVPAATGDCGQRMVSFDATAGKPLLFTTGDNSWVTVTTPGGDTYEASSLVPTESGKYYVTLPAAQTLSIAPLPADVLMAGSSTQVSVGSGMTTLKVFVDGTHPVNIQVAGQGSAQPYIKLLRPDGTEVATDYADFYKSIATVSPPSYDTAAQIYLLTVQDNYGQPGTFVVNVVGQ